MEERLKAEAARAAAQGGASNSEGGVGNGYAVTNASAAAAGVVSFRPRTGSSNMFRPLPLALDSESGSFGGGGGSGLPLPWQAVASPMRIAISRQGSRALSSASGTRALTSSHGLPRAELSSFTSGLTHSARSDFFPLNLLVIHFFLCFIFKYNLYI